jgi:hypothetical protein
MINPYLDRLSIAIIYPTLFAIHMTLALLAELRHFPTRSRGQRIMVHILTAMGFAGIGLSTGPYPYLPKVIMSPIVRTIWMALIVVWGVIFVQNILNQLRNHRHDSSE